MRQSNRDGAQKQLPRLSKRDRVLKTLQGKEVDKRPFCLWFPFGLNHLKGESLATVALTFAATYGIDLLRLPLVRDLPLQDQTSIDRPHDLTQLDVLNAHSGFWVERLEALKLLSSSAEQKIAIFETIPGPLTALSYVCHPELLKKAESENPNFLEKALENVTASLKNYLTQLFKDKSCDGLVVELESLSFEQREPEQFDALVKPYLKDLLNFVRQESEYPIWLQARGARCYVKPLVDLPHNLISWPHLSSGPKLENAFPKGYRGQTAGGIDEKAIETMSFQDIRRHVEEARNMRVSLLCPGDQLPTDLSPSRLKALANFLGKRDRKPED